LAPPTPFSGAGAANVDYSQMSISG